MVINVDKLIFNSWNPECYLMHTFVATEHMYVLSITQFASFTRVLANTLISVHTLVHWGYTQDIAYSKNLLWEEISANHRILLLEEIFVIFDYLYTAVLSDCWSERNGLYNDSLLFNKLVSTTCFNYKAMSTNDTNCSCHNLLNQSYGVYTTSHHANSYL